MGPLAELSSPSNPELGVEGDHDDAHTVEEIVYVDDDEDGSYIEEIIDEEDGSYIEEIIEEVTVAELEPDDDDETADNRQDSDDRNDASPSVIDGEGGEDDANEDTSSSVSGYDDDSSAAALSADSDAPVFEGDLGQSFREDAGVDLLTKRRKEIQEEMQKAAMSEGARKAKEEELAREKARESQNEDEHIRLDETEQRTASNDMTESTRRKQREALLRQKQQDEAARRRLEEEIRKVDMALEKKRETAAQTRIEGAQQVEKQRKALAELRRQAAREELARSNEALKAEREARGLSNMNINARTNPTKDNSARREQNLATDVIELFPLSMDVTTTTTSSADTKASLPKGNAQDFIAPTPLLANTRKRRSNTYNQSTIDTTGGGDIKAGFSLHGSAGDSYIPDDSRKPVHDDESGKEENGANNEQPSEGQSLEKRPAEENSTVEEAKLIAEAKRREEARLKEEAAEKKLIVGENTAEEDTRRKEIEAKSRAEDTRRAEEESRLKAEQEAKLKLKSEEEARLKAEREEKARIKAEQDAKLKVEQETARLNAIEDARAAEENLIAEKSRNEEKQRVARISKEMKNGVQSQEEEQDQAETDASFPKSPVVAIRKKFENKSMAVPKVFNPLSPVGQARKKFEKSKTSDEASLPVSSNGTSRSKFGNNEVSDEAAAIKVKKPKNLPVPAAFRTKSSIKTVKSSDRKAVGPTSSTTDGRYYPIDDLRARKIGGLDYTCREQYLSPEDFLEYFKMKKDEFAKLPKWKRDKAKRSLKLF